LLQNENGPCPLLAAANALLLRGEVSLPIQAVRQNVASIENVVNMLAGRALKSEENSSYHIDELLKLFPSLQYGMDVNPKFTVGPTGVEYTKGLSAFDLMGVELVHGWLIDALDEQHGNVIGSKSYNELTETMIMGNEASEEMQKIDSRIRELQKQIPDEDKEKNQVDDVATGASAAAADQQTPLNDSGNVDGVDGTQQAIDALDINDNSDLEPILEQIRKLAQEHESQSKIFQHGVIISDFLSTTSTQLTYSGLTELHNYVKEGAMCVFFRNNHFSTMTKHEGILYLLITDLGYQNAPGVIWEKLDDISGDTEYADQDFIRTKPAAELISTGGPSLAPEQLLAQSSRAEADYQLALQLSRNERAIDDQEGRLIAAATAASLEAYNHEQNGISIEDTNGTTSIRDSSSTPTDNADSNVSVSFATASEEQDKIMALQMQRQFEEDDARQRMTQQAQMQARNRDVRQKNDGGCLIS
jgi:hypothetical protein